VYESLLTPIQFIPCDLVSLLLQAAGGGLASAESNAGKRPDIGDNIMVAGLAFQVLTLGIFIILCADFALNTHRRYKSLGSDAFDQNPHFITLRNSVKFKGFLAALALATLCIFWRSVYRVVELAEGWTGNLIRRQNLFIGFEGVMVIIAVLALNVFHPAFCFAEGVTGAGGIGTSKKNKQVETHEKSLSLNGSDAEVKTDTVTV
jgi:hypothetical protein